MRGEVLNAALWLEGRGLLSATPGLDYASRTHALYPRSTLLIQQWSTVNPFLHISSVQLILSLIPKPEATSSSSVY